MKKLKQGLLLAVLLLLGAYVAIPLAKHQVDLWRIKKISDLFRSFEYDYLYDMSAGNGKDQSRIGLIKYGESYQLVTVSLPDLWQDAVVQYTPTYQADTGDETIRAWYGICGTEAEPQLLILLDEDNPRCRDLSLEGNGSAGQIGTQEPVKMTLSDLNGLPDDDNRIMVTLYASGASKAETSVGTGLNDTLEQNAKALFEGAEEIEETKESYLSFSIDLTEALARTDW